MKQHKVMLKGTEKIKTMHHYLFSIYYSIFKGIRLFEDM